MSLHSNFQISQRYKSGSTARLLYAFIRDFTWTKFVFKTLFKIPRICKNIILRMDNVLIRAGAHPASYPKGNGGSFPGVKAARA